MAISPCLCRIVAPAHGAIQRASQHHEAERGRSPTAEIHTSAAKATGVFRLVCVVTITQPRPACEATNSPTIAPTTAAVAVILSALRMYGSAFGIRILTNTFHLGALNTRPRSSSSASIWVRPTAVLITTGKNPISAPISMFGTTP